MKSVEIKKTKLLFNIYTYTYMYTYMCIYIYELYLGEKCYSYG